VSLPSTVPSLVPSTPEPELELESELDPSGSALLDVLAPIDDVGDRLFDRLRGRQAPDTAAAVVSNLADYGVVWMLLAAFKGRRRGPGRRRAITALALAGFGSYGLNRVVKQAIGRERPNSEGPAESLVRQPTSSSFPSGHTLAAFCAAVAIPETTGGVAAATAFAGAVAGSRVHLRAHHPSDVVAGAVLGTALGVLVRGVLRKLE